MTGQHLTFNLTADVFYFAERTEFGRGAEGESKKLSVGGGVSDEALMMQSGTTRP